MSIIPILIVVAVLILAAFLLMNKKDVEQEREGFVKDILKKDALLVEFDDGKASIVKFYGVKMASDNEMLDEKILELMQDSLLGARVIVKPKSVGAGDIVVGGVYTLGGEYVNAVLVQQGYGRWSAIEAGTDHELAEAQEVAKAQQLGVWNPAVRQLVEDKMRSQSSDAMSDDEIANLQVDPEQVEREAREGREG